MSKRKISLIKGRIYHIFTKSIAGFEIYRDDLEFVRMINLFSYYQKENPLLRFSTFIEIKNKEKFLRKHKDFSSKDNLVAIIAYCLMPTHIHLILKQTKKNGISEFMRNILDSYTRYFNIKTKRKGPLWESKFQNVIIETDEQLLHLTRYIHLNPVTAYLVNRPQDWKFSSYREFLGKIKTEERITNYSNELDIQPAIYKDFVEKQIDYQRELSQIKKLFIE